MEDYIVKDVLKKIVEIDEKRRHMESEMVALKAHHQGLLEDKIKKLQRQMMKETRIKAKAKIQALNEQTDQMEKEILDQGTAYVEMMTKNFDQTKEGCIQEIMDRMFNKN